MMSCVYTMLKSADVCFCEFVSMCVRSVPHPCGVSWLATLWSDMMTGRVHRLSHLNMPT